METPRSLARIRVMRVLARAVARMRQRIALHGLTPEDRRRYRYLLIDLGAPPGLADVLVDSAAAVPLMPTLPPLSGAPVSRRQRLFVGDP